MNKIFMARLEAGVSDTWYEIEAVSPKRAAIDFMEEYVGQSGDIDPRMIEIKGYGSFGVGIKFYIYEEPRV